MKRRSAYAHLLSLLKLKEPSRREEHFDSAISMFNPDSLVCILEWIQSSFDSQCLNAQDSVDPMTLSEFKEMLVALTGLVLDLCEGQGFVINDSIGRRLHACITAFSRSILSVKQFMTLI